MFKNSSPISFESEWKVRRGGNGFFIALLDIPIFIVGGVIGLIAGGVPGIVIWVLTAVLMGIVPLLLNAFIKSVIRDDMMKDLLLNKNTVYNFTFDETELTIVAEKSGAEILRVSAKYDDIKSIEEKDEFLCFSLPNQRRPIHMQAGGMTEGSFEDLTNFLSLKCPNTFL